MKGRSFCFLILRMAQFFVGDYSILMDVFYPNSESGLSSLGFRIGFITISGKRRPLYNSALNVSEFSNAEESWIGWCSPPIQL